MKPNQEQYALIYHTIYTTVLYYTILYYTTLHYIFYTIYYSILYNTSTGYFEAEPGAVGSGVDLCLPQREKVLPPADLFVHAAAAV
jgi:hypothetical protein